MSGSFASPWVANSRVEYCREKFMEVTATESTTELKKKLLSLSFSELRQVEMNAFISNPCFYFTLTGIGQIKKMVFFLKKKKISY